LNVAAFSLPQIAKTRLDRLVVQEIEGARPRLRRLRRRYPLISERILAQQLIDEAKAYAGTGGMVSGMLGLIGLPADLLLVTFLQLRLSVEIGLLYNVNLKTERGLDQLLEVLGRGNGVGPLVRTGPTVFARLALKILQKKGLPSLGRALPFIASPISAWLNNRDIQRVGDEALLLWGSHRQLKAKRRSSGEAEE